jgi:hypothetical protein
VQARTDGRRSRGNPLGRIGGATGDDAEPSQPDEGDANPQDGKQAPLVSGASRERNTKIHVHTLARTAGGYRAVNATTVMHPRSP